MATCNICKYAGTPSYKSPCSECKGFSKYEYEKLQTNADRIRAMDDEELANMLTEFSNNSGWVTETGRKICYERHIKWLQSPAE